MLAPAIGESLTRWEELGSGFSGHGFDDRDKERFLPDPHPPIEAVASGQTYAEWFREKRATTVHNASERLSNIRARLFRWRLLMREVEKEEVVHPVPKTAIGGQSSPTSSKDEGAPQPSAIGQATRQEEQPQTQAEVRKSKSWVWQWTRHG